MPCAVFVVIEPFRSSLRPTIYTSQAFWCSYSEIILRNFRLMCRYSKMPGNVKYMTFHNLGIQAPARRTLLPSQAAQSMTTLMSGLGDGCESMGNHPWFQSLSSCPYLRKSTLSFLLPCSSIVWPISFTSLEHALLRMLLKAWTIWKRAQISYTQSRRRGWKHFLCHMKIIAMCYTLLGTSCSHMYLKMDIGRSHLSSK